MIQVIDNFNYRGEKPNFYRDSFSTYQDMLDFPDHFLDDGHISYVIEKKQHYKYDKVNSKWVPFISGGSGQIDIAVLGAIGDGKTDVTDIIQNAIDLAYVENKKVYIPAGTYLITRALFVYDGIYIQGDGIYNTILKTPFSKNDIAKSYVVRDKVAYNTISDQANIPDLDLVNGHNRFYIGDGVIGYYDADRDTNPNHPLYWANDGSNDWNNWNNERTKIIQRGCWIGKTGREGYAKGLFLCSQNPNIFYTEDKLSPYYDQTHPKGRVFTGVRNVTIVDLQINTNSTDRGKDTAINFNYKSSDIPSNIRETYDSSVLNIFLKGLYLFSIGGSGIRMTRAVDVTIQNCYIRQCAEYGIKMEGVTSINISGCYTNGCLEGGYVLKGCNYTTLSACASDSCSIGYNIYNCKGLSLLSCGAEATRYQKATEIDEEDQFKGRAFCIRNSSGISLLSCYAMSSHPKVYTDDVVDITDEEQDPNWLKSRHIMVMDSDDIQICYFYFKSFERMRSTPYRDDNNQKVNYLGGIYDPTQPGSRYWQVQNYLVGAQFEIRGGDDSSVRIISTENKEKLVKTSEIRCNNLDILDPGIIQNPLYNDGYNTAGKTLSGDDGNGGWTITKSDGSISKIEFENFEFIFPINAKKLYGERTKFWEWRNSLILLRRHTDKSLMETYPSKYFGYIEILGESQITPGVNWTTAMQDTVNFVKYKIDIVTDYNKTSLIDGGKEFFSYGKFSWQQLNQPIAYEPSIFSPIPAYIRDKANGSQIVLNVNDIKDFPTEVIKSAVSIIGNNKIEATTDTEEIIPSTVLTVMSREKVADIGEKKIFHCTNIAGNDLFSVYANDKRLGLMGHRIISIKDSDYSNISKVQENDAVANSILAKKINSIIERLTVHGFIEEPTETLIFNITSVNTTVTSFEITFTITTEIPLYHVGAAYSSNNQTPNYSNNHVAATVSANDVYIVNVPRSETNPERYIRFYANISEVEGDTTRLYSPSYKFNANGTYIEI